MHFFLSFFSFDFCHYGSGGAAVDSPPTQQDPYLSPQFLFILIACSVPEIWPFKVCCQILTFAAAAAAAVRSRTFGCLRF
jgi:hypothetical protein